MNIAATQAPSAAEIVLAYHARTKHCLKRYAAGPETLDWDMQPNPFREFAGCVRTQLELGARRLATSFAEACKPVAGWAAFSTCRRQCCGRQRYDTADEGVTAVVERLLAKGADVAPETLDGFSALDLAQTIECLRLLRPRRSLNAASEPSRGGPPACPA